MRIAIFGTGGVGGGAVAGFEVRAIGVCEDVDENVLITSLSNFNPLQHKPSPICQVHTCHSTDTWLCLACHTV